MLIFFLKLTIKIYFEFQSFIDSMNWHITCQDIIELDKAKPRVIVGRKAAGPTGIAGLPNSELNGKETGLPWLY
jgi:hypothetical protein